MFSHLVPDVTESAVSKDRKIAVSLNLDRRAWWRFQELCRANALGYGQAVEAAIIGVMEKHGVWPPVAGAQGSREPAE